MTEFLRTIMGDIDLDEVGLVLPHEHLFTDLRGPDHEGYAQADPDYVAAIMLPYLEEAYDAGVTALVECSTIGVGRNIDVLLRLAQNTRIHLLAPTGLYREAYTPEIYKQSTVEELAELWILELTEAIGMTDSKAGFIKIALSDDGPTDIEMRNLRAAVRASKATTAAIASHTIGGEPALRELSILETEGLDPQKFIWVHASSEPGQHYHETVAAHGAFLEFDSIGGHETDHEILASMVLDLFEKGFGNRILLSHDAGWFQPGNPGGQPEGGIRGYTALMDNFIPLLRQRGLDNESIQLLTVENPKRAFSMKSV